MTSLYMGAIFKMANSEDEEGVVLHFHDQNLRKLERWDGKKARILILDGNELTRLEYVDTYGELEKLSVTDNKLVRMYGICNMRNLQVLNLANNSILAIEGLRELVNLKWLSLAGNKIKTIQHLKTNLQLTFLDFSANSISSLGSLCHLKSLKTLLMSKNDITALDHASSLLPHCLEVLSVSCNAIADLNQISYLSGLASLQQLFIANNPCVTMTAGSTGFDYRSFVVNWCLGLKILDGYVIGPKECLKAEWLYCQGKGRHFRPGEHAELTEYLAQVCPLTADSLQSEEDAKLTRILTKQRQHQQELLHGQVPTCTSAPITDKLPSLMSGKPRAQSACPQTWTAQRPKRGDFGHRLCTQGDQSAPVFLVSESRYVPLPEAVPSPDVGPMSLSSYVSRFEGPSSPHSPEAIASRIPQRMTSSTDSPLLRRHTQLQRVKRVARPLSLSPSCRRRIPVVHVFGKAKQANRDSNSSSDNESSDSELSLSKLRRVHEMAHIRLGIPTSNETDGDNIKNGEGLSNPEKTLQRAATLIQATWRGYWVRHHHGKAVGVRQEIRIRRAEDRVLSLQQELRKTRQEYENEKRMRELQMEAIRALWKEVLLLQNTRAEAGAAADSGVDVGSKCGCGEGSGPEEAESTAADPKKPTSLALHSRSATPDTPTDMMQQLVNTCGSLQAQVQELQEALRTMSCMMFSNHVHRRLGEGPRQMSTSSPFFSAVASPVTNPDTIAGLFGTRRVQSPEDHDDKPPTDP